LFWSKRAEKLGLYIITFHTVRFFSSWNLYTKMLELPKFRQRSLLCHPSSQPQTRGAPCWSFIHKQEGSLGKIVDTFFIFCETSLAAPFQESMAILIVGHVTREWSKPSPLVDSHIVRENWEMEEENLREEKMMLDMCYLRIKAYWRKSLFHSVSETFIEHQYCRVVRRKMIKSTSVLMKYSFPRSLNAIKFFLVLTSRGPVSLGSQPTSWATPSQSHVQDLSPLPMSGFRSWVSASTTFRFIPPRSHPTSSLKCHQYTVSSLLWSKYEMPHTSHILDAWSPAGSTILGGSRNFKR
jgi:hypothetical protein